MSIATPPNLVKLLHHSSSHNTPGMAERPDPYSAPRPLTPGGVVMLVSEIANIILAGTLLPPPTVKQRPFAAQSTSMPYHVEKEELHHPQTVQASHMARLLAQPIVDLSERRLSSTNGGVPALEGTQKAAARWLNELMESSTDVMTATDLGRRGSLFSIGPGGIDEEIELTVAVLVSTYPQGNVLALMTLAASLEYAHSASGRTGAIAINASALAFI